MSKYGEYLKTLGASDDEIKVLDTPIAARAFDKQQDDLAKATSTRDAAIKEQRDYEEKVDAWYKENNDKYSTLQKSFVVTQAEAARAKAALLAAQEQGLLDVAKDLGWKMDDKNTPPPPDKSVNADTSQFVSRDEVVKLARAEREAILVSNEILGEHAELFPGQRLDLRSLVDEAEKRHIPAKQLWEERFKVPDARAARAKAEQDAHDKKVADDAVAAARTAWVSQYGNPETRPLVPSRSPFAARSGDDLRAKQPWQSGESTLSNDRVSRAAKKVAEALIN